MKKIRFAVVGAGMIGKRHIAMINQNPNAQLCAVCDVRGREQTGVADAVDYYSDMRQMLDNHPEIDVVNICTPNGLHPQMAVFALENGKHTVVEKPLALSVEEAQKVVEAEKRSGKIAFMVMQNRYSPPSVWLKQILAEKRLGQIYTVNVNCLWNRDERYYIPGHWHGTKDMDGGTLFTQFSHFIDLLNWLVGPVGKINYARFADFAHAHLTDFEDSGTAVFDIAGGGIGTLTYSTAVWETNLESSITITGSRGSVKVAGQYMNEVVSCHIDGYEMPKLPESNKPNDYGAYKGSAANHQYVIDNVVETINHLAKPTANVHEGLAVVDIIERIYARKEKVLFASDKILCYQL